jgi:hypothetical protein
VKIKIRPDDTGPADEAELVATDHWLARLREEDRAPAAVPVPPAQVALTPADPWPAVPPTPADPWPAVPPAPAASTEPTPEPQPAPEPQQKAEPEPEPEPTVRAIIGDELRVPTTWCEMGRCISSFVEPGALGEADNRAHAMAAGWRLDAFNRLACPSCQERDPSFRSQQPVVPWDRREAMATATRMTGPHAGPGPFQASR